MLFQFVNLDSDYSHSYPHVLACVFVDSLGALCTLSDEQSVLQWMRRLLQGNIKC